MALAWILARKPCTVPITGTTKLHRLGENLAATTLVIPPDDLTALDRLATELPVQGSRYPDAMERMINR